MKQIPELSPEQREKYGKELQYIKNSVDNLNNSLKTSDQLNSEIEKVHAKCLDLHKSVDTTAAQYEQLNQAILRFKTCITDFNNLNTDIEKAWNELGEVEQKLKSKQTTDSKAN